MKLLNTLTNNILLELSASLKQKIVDKFKKETNDSVDIITDLVDKFETIQINLPSNKRDINRYNYKDLKSAVALGVELKISKNGGFTLRDIFSYLKKINTKIPDAQAKLYIKKYLEIRSDLPNRINNVYNYRNYDELVKIINDNYSTLLIPKMVKKFMDENSFLTKDIAREYIQRYIENFNTIPITTKPIINLSFTELEHLIDSFGDDTKNLSDKTTRENIPVVYNENGLIIWSPRNKEECIDLQQGRPWCTSKQGAGNYYHKYKFVDNLTVYYVTDNELEFDDLNYASVILIDRNGKMRLADKTNSKPYDGGTIHPWSTIVSKIPKLEGLEHLLKWRPLTDKEFEVFSKFNKLEPHLVGNNPLEYFNGDIETLDLWMEINSPALSDIQYKNLPVESKKKWIGLHMPISPGMIVVSEPEVFRYILSKSKEKLINKTLSELTETEINSINRPESRSLKKYLKEKFIKEIGYNLVSENKCSITYPSSIESKYIILYGLDDLIDTLPNYLEKFMFMNQSETNLHLQTNKLFEKCKNLTTLILKNCVNELPTEICNLNKLKDIAIVDNADLIKIPECIFDLPSIMMMNFNGSKNIILPDNINKNFTESPHGRVFFSKVLKFN